MQKDYQLQENEILEIKGDRIFHDLWNEHEMDTIEWTAMQILECSYDEIHGKVKVGNIRIPNLSKEDKQKYVDLVVYYKDTITVIELNNNASTNYLRNVLYAMNQINNSYIEGSKYSEKKIRGILVNLNWFNNPKEKTFKDKEEIIYGYPLIGQEKSDYLLKIVNINLDYFSRICYDEIKKSDYLWKLFTINKKDELTKMINGEKLLLNYGKKIERLSQSKEYCRMIWDERIERNLRAQQEYFDGKQDGIEEKQNEMITNLYKNGASIDLICKASKLTREEVEEIIKENK